jgi:hypothetical protein
VRRLFHIALVFHGGFFGGIGIPFLHPATMIAIPYLAQLQWKGIAVISAESRKCIANTYL